MTRLLRSVAVGVLLGSSLSAKPEVGVPLEGLLVDLDPARGVELSEGSRVESWRNQAPGEAARVFKRQDEGRKEAGSGRPTLKPAVPGLGGKPTVVFRRQELVSEDDESLDGLTTGSGMTFLTVISPLEQKPQLKDVNSFFGNLRNGKFYEGVWASFDDDNTLWIGGRNGKSFGRFDANNPKLYGPRLVAGSYHVIGGRLASGTGNAKLEVFCDSAETVGSALFPVNPDADPSRPAIGQERDAIEHPGKESADVEIARFLIWGRPLGDDELAKAIASLKVTYQLD